MDVSDDCERIKCSADQSTSCDIHVHVSSLKLTIVYLKLPCCEIKIWKKRSVHVLYLLRKLNGNNKNDEEGHVKNAGLISMISWKMVNRSVGIIQLLLIEI